MTDDKRKLPDEPAEPISAAEDQQEAAEPVKENPAADGVIRLDVGEYDPTLDPNSPEFDREKWEEYKDHAIESLKKSLKTSDERAQEIFTEEFSSLFKGSDVSGIVKKSFEDLRDSYIASMAEIMRPAIEMGAAFKEMTEGLSKTLTITQGIFNSDEWQQIRKTLEMITATAPEWLELMQETEELMPFLEAEIQKPEYGGKTLDDLFAEAEIDDDFNPIETSLFMQAVNAARAALKVEQEKQKLIDRQTAGREQRREIRKAAEGKNAVMELQGGRLPMFSERSLWDAFAPDRISKLGELPGTETIIDEETGEFVSGEIQPLHAADISLNTFLLLNAIVSNTVEDYRQFFIDSGAITFYVKGVLDSLNVDPRIKDDGQLNFERKTAGVLYLEKQFEPLQGYVGTTPNGSRYSVLNYYGYDIESDTMTIRTPYLFQLWQETQEGYRARKINAEKRKAAGKKPLKADAKPLEINSLLKGAAYKEDDSVLEIALYITNVLVNAGSTKTGRTKKTEIKYKTIIDNCPRLKERLTEIENLPAKYKEKRADGKEVTINNSDVYNRELRKIATAWRLITDKERCDVLDRYEIISITPSKETRGRIDLVPPTKRTITGKITLEWRTKEQ